jgi:hypothetical protein
VAIDNFLFITTKDVVAIDSFNRRATTSCRDIIATTSCRHHVVAMMSRRIHHKKKVKKKKKSFVATPSSGQIWNFIQKFPFLAAHTIG